VADDSSSRSISDGVEMTEVIKDARRSRRVIFKMPVNVYIYRENEEPMFEVAITLTVSAHGALLALTTSVRLGGMLRLVNPRTRNEIECHVCRFAMRYPSGVTQVGVEFATASPTFWDVPSPPPNWDPAWVPRAERMHFGRPTNASEVSELETELTDTAYDSIQPGAPGISTDSTNPSDSMRDSRRNIQIPVEILVLLYGHAGNKGPLYVEGRTISVSKHGAFLAVHEALEVGQSLLLTIAKTCAEIVCDIHSVSISADGEHCVGVEFATASPEFWGVTFPTEDQEAAEAQNAQRLPAMNDAALEPSVEVSPGELGILEPATQSPGIVEQETKLGTPPETAEIVIPNETKPNLQLTDIVEQDTKLDILPEAAENAIASDIKSNSRRSTRLLFQIPVVVQILEENRNVVSSLGKSIQINVNGALLAVPMALSIGQSLLLIHSKTAKEIQCVVRSVHLDELGMNHVAVEFETASPRFWGVNFPPEDWDATERKLPQRPVPLKSAPLKPSVRSIAANQMSETQMIIEDAVRAQDSYVARGAETKPKRPLPTKVAPPSPLPGDRTGHSLTNLQKILAEAYQEQQESVKASEVKTNPIGQRIVSWSITLLAACVVMIVIWAVIHKSNAGGSAAPRNLVPSGVAPEDAMVIPGLEGFRLATPNDFDPGAISWLRGVGPEPNGEIPGAFTANGQSKAYVLVGADAMWRIVILADGKLRCDAKYRSVAIVARVPERAIQNITWADPPRAGSEGDGILVVRAANDLGTSVVLLLSGDEVVSGTPTDFRQIPLK
jgi:hypothetical protein